MEQETFGLVSSRGQTDAPIRRGQLRRLHALWRRWARPLRLSPQANRRLRHYYVRLFSRGRAHQTLQLGSRDAARVIAWLERLISRSSAAQKRAAGTAGRHGYPDRRSVRPDAAAWRALRGAASALGMSRDDLDRFIASHYAALGLRGVDDLGSMADLNRVLWGLKAILRRKPRRHPAFERRAA